MPSSTISSMKKLVREYAPQKWSDGNTVFSTSTKPSVHETYVDPAQRQALEAALNRNKEFSHKPFNSSMPVFPERGNFGGWSGTFAKNHGGYPHMFETDPDAPDPVPQKAPLQKKPVYVNVPKKNRIGYANRGLGEDPEFINPGDIRTQERMNQGFRWGLGDVYRPKCKSAEPFKFSTPAGVFDGNASMKSVDVPLQSNAMNRRRRREELQARAMHAARWNSGAVGAQYTGAFSSHKYMNTAPLDSSSKKKPSSDGVKLPPFKATTTGLSRASPSVLFRDRKSVV